MKIYHRNCANKIYHRSCANKLKKCCEEEITFTTTDDPSQESESDDSVHEISEYSSQDLLLKLIREMGGIIRLLEENNHLLEANTYLLKYRISILENQINNKEPKIRDLGEKQTNIRNEENVNNRDKRGKQQRRAADLCIDNPCAVTNDLVQSTSKDEPRGRPQITDHPQSNAKVIPDHKKDEENKTNTNA